MLSNKLTLIELQIESDRILESLTSIADILSQFRQRDKINNIPLDQTGTPLYDAVHGHEEEQDIIRHLEDYYLLLRPEAKKLTEILHNMRMEGCGW